MEWRKYNEEWDLEKWKKVIDEGGLQAMYNTYRFDDGGGHIITAPLLTCAAYNNNVELMKYIVSLKLVNPSTGMTAWQEYESRTHVKKACELYANESSDLPYNMQVMCYESSRIIYLYDKGPLEAAQMMDCKEAEKYMKEDVLCRNATVR